MKSNSYVVFAICLTFDTGCLATAVQSGTYPPMEAGQPESISAPVMSPETEQIRTRFWLESEPVQGAIIIAHAPSNTESIWLDGVAVPVAKDGFFLIGFDRDAAAEQKLVAILADGRSVEETLSIAPGDWKIEHVNTRPTGGAKNSAEFLRRRGAEIARINDARKISHDVAGWRQSFIWPLNGRISGQFGSQRIYQGTPGSYHSGMDIAAPAGTEFLAPADGVVTLAAENAFTLEGHLIIIDHGMGLNSAFLHASQILVKEGDIVKQGQVIGRVGMTGRASGPHLHWGMKWEKARIDPKSLLPSH